MRYKVAFRPLFRNLFVASCLSLVACTVGPDFKSPQAPSVDNRYTREAILTNPEQQQLDLGAELPAEWWKTFNSPEINQWVETALKNNPSIQIAEASLRVADHNMRAQYAAFFPAAQTNFSKSRQQDPIGTLSPTLNTPQSIYNLYNANLAVGYAPDVFGLNRRAVESLQAQKEIQQAQIEATYITLASNVATLAVSLAAVQDQIREINKQIEINTNALTLIKKQQALGAASGLDVAAQETILSQLEASLPSLNKQRELLKDQLATLLGQSPSDLQFNALSLDQITLPQHLPVSLPSTLVKQRPDIKAAESQVHIASAQVGIALANRLPLFTIAAVMGGTSTAIGALFSQGNRFWSLAGNGSLNVLDFGGLKQKQNAAEAYLDQATAQYRLTALLAFQNVADTLYAIDNDQQAYEANLRAEASAKKTLKITHAQKKAGDINILTVWTAQSAYQQAKINLIQAKALRYTDTIALFQALGGSWESSKSLEQSTQH
jgi:NodT family efflux transporter outer membrane factor (OMF) lipoprotein